MIKIFTITIALLVSLTLQAQNDTTGIIAGKLTDKEMNGESLPFANVLIKGSSKGATTDMDGLYSIQSLSPGEYTLAFSFVGYETREVTNVIVEAGKITEVNAELGSSAASLDEVVITTVSRKDSEVALLLEQKKAVDIKESIGARELARLGVSDVATATTRISGVSSSEASGDIFVRGLGDRYLYTTLNGLPVPSDDVERKNIDLELFPTGVIQSVSIRKTYSATTSADQASGNIDITTRELIGTEEFGVSVGAGINTNVIQEGVFDNFRISPNMSHVRGGFYTGSNASVDKLTHETWTPGTADLPMNYKYSLSAGKRLGDDLELFLTASKSTSHEHGQGVFREFRANYATDSITDAEIFSKTVNTTGLASVAYKFNQDHSIRANSLFVNKLTDEVYEGGRNGEGFIFEETDPSEGLSQFIRDQNTKQTRLWINQLIGEHRVSERNSLEWSTGINLVNADEPNRIRNEVNFNEDVVYLGNTGGFQQRKTSQEIEDREFNAMISDRMLLILKENKEMDISVGGNYRYKERDFISKFYGLEETTTNSLTPPSIDDISEVLNPENLQNDLLDVNELQADRYRADLTSAAGFITFNYNISEWNLNAGLRYQRDEMNLDFNVGNIPGRTGSSNLNYDNIYPALNLRYALNERQNIRLAASKTITLPEFKEVSPFEYVSQTGQVTRGNPDLMASTNYNVDLKWEFFPTTGQLLSLTGFYKSINDPINKVQDRGSAGVFSFFNAGDEAQILGLELESRVDLLSMEEGHGIDMNLGLNATRMWHEQDLKEIRDENGSFLRTFRYKGLTKTDLQGASDWIFNSSLNMITGSKNPLMMSLSASYASDKVYALGAPERQSDSETFYNDAIIEKGFVTLDAVITKELGTHWSLKLSGKNLLNPEVERVQNIRPSTTGIETTEIVRSYTRGTILSVGINYSL